MKKWYLIFPIFFIECFCLAQTPNTWVQRSDVGWNSPNGPPIRDGAIGFSIGGKGYIGTGNVQGSFVLNDFWEWDQASNSWIRKSDLPANGRILAVGFSIGNKGYIGTGWDFSSDFNDFWEWDQVSNLWTQKADFAGVGRSSAVGFSIGSKGYIGTGSAISTVPSLRNDLWEWDQNTNTWSPIANFLGRYYATGFSIGSKGYIGTGQGPSNVVYNDFWEWDQATNTWTQKANFGGAPRIWATSFSIGNKGYIGMGSDGITGMLNDFWEWDQGANSWTRKANIGGKARFMAAGFSIGTKGYIGPGRIDTGKTFKSFYLNDFWEWDQATDTWIEKAYFGTWRRANATGFSTNSKGYVGLNVMSSFDNEFWEWNPTTDVWTKKANFPGAFRDEGIGFGINGKCYMGAGRDFLNIYNDFWEWDPVSNIWTQKANVTPRRGAVSFSIGNRGYIGTGWYGSYNSDLFEWNQATNTWVFKTFFGANRDYAVAFSIGTKGYIGTGYDGAKYLNDFWEWDQTTNVWTQKSDFSGTARYHASGFSIGSRGYICMGNDGSGNKNDLWEWDQASNIWTQKANCGGVARSSAISFNIGNKGYIGTGGLTDFWEYYPGVIATNFSTLSLCQGESTTVSFTTPDTYNAGNIFSVQLSNSAGGFAGATIIGSLSGTTSGNINITIPTNVSAGTGYRMRVVSSNPAVIGDDNLTNITVNARPILNLKLFTQGYYVNGGTLKKVLYNEKVEANSSLTKVDSIVIELHNTTSPYNLVESYKGILQTNGTIACNFSCNITGHSYYIAVKHRNTIQTWSAAPVLFSSTTNYDFTTASNKAYGNNMIQMETGRWAFYTGDINQDGNIDLLDFPTLDTGIIGGLTGYYASDLNGDGNVDIIDFPLLDANIIAGIFSVHP